MMRIKLSFVLSAASISIASADIAPNPMYSEGIQPFDQTKIQMVDETVTVDLFKDHSKVRVEFNMKNHGDKETLEVGFPNIVGNLSTNDCLKNFTISVDEKFYSFKSKSKTHSTSLRRYKKNKPEFINWFVWDMTFQKMENKKVVVSYEQPYGGKYSSGLLNSRYFSYVLETGAGWHKTIEKATVVVLFKDMSKDHLISAKPESYSIDGNSVKWVFQNLEPTRSDNIFIDYNYHKDYSDYVKSNESSMNTNSWKLGWQLAYACNKAGEYELATRFAEQGLDIPLTGDRAMQFRDIAELQLYKQIALYKQLVMARYQLYLNDNSADNRDALQETLNQLKTLTAQISKNPEAMDRIFPHDNNYRTAAYEWLMSEFMMNDENISYRSAELGIFISRWNDRIEAAIKGLAKVQLIEQHVTIDLYKNHSDVNAVFHFKNPGANATVEVALEDIAGDYLLSDLFTDFRLLIDNEPAPIETKPVPSASESWNRSNWNPTWQVPFKSKESKTIEVMYRVPHENKHDNGLLGTRKYQHLLGNSAEWCGSIEHATVVVNLKDMTAEHLSFSDQSGYSIVGNSLTWEFKKWEPGYRDRVEIYYNCYKDYGDYAANHRNKEMTQWRDAWKLAYAYNKAGQYELAAQIAELGIAMSYDKNESDETTVAEEERSRRTPRDTESLKLKQIALHKQLVMARYQLYLKDERELNQTELQEALDGLKEWTSQGSKNPEFLGKIFPLNNYEAATCQWLMTEYIIDDEGLFGLDLGTFGRLWKRRINEVAHPKNPKKN